MALLSNATMQFWKQKQKIAKDQDVFDVKLPMILPLSVFYSKCLKELRLTWLNFVLTPPRPSNRMRAIGHGKIQL